MADKYLKIRLDEKMLEKLKEVAKRNRRDTHSHVLYLIDREIIGYIGLPGDYE